MKKFSFQLEPVLKYQQDRLEILKNEHAKIINKIMQQEKKIQQMEEKIIQYTADFNEKKQMGIVSIEAVNCQNYLEQQEYFVLKEYEILQQMKQEEEKKKIELLEFKKKILTIEKLKEIHMKEYQKVVSREEEQFIEEFVSNSQTAKKD